MNTYIGHPSQLYGVTEYRLSGGKSNGMRMLYVYNGKGLEFEISLDRCADIVRVRLNGMNMAYISPCGMVAPEYYDNRGAEFLKSFTAGFMTTCGLNNVGIPCTYDGETLPMHGNISHAPAENYSWNIEDDAIKIHATIRDASLFSHQLVLEREFVCSLKENTIAICDTIKNIGAKKSPYMILYHCNMGYPLLSEDAELSIPSCEVLPRDAAAEKGIKTWTKIIPPEDNFDEQCFFHKFTGNPTVSLYNPKFNIGMNMRFDISELDFFTQWKMMGKYEYVIGLEPGNCLPIGRDAARKDGTLKFLDPGEQKINHLKFDFFTK